MTGGMWAGRLGILIAVIIVAQASAALAFFFVVIAFVGAICLFLYKGSYLPRFVMDILDRLSNKAKIEDGVKEKDKEITNIDAAQLAAKLKAKVIGQDAVIDQIAAQLRRRVAAKRKDKPLAVFCFAGAPGVGKSHLAKVLAEALYGDKTHLLFVEMATCDKSEASWSLFGSPQGYVGGPGTLTSGLRDVPDSVVLLDEFEKAHRDVHKRFLSAWNDGFITDLRSGEKIPTNKAIFILTTNAACKRIGELARDHTGSLEELDRMVKSTLADVHFVPEVLSRIDEVFAFREMQGLDIARVVALLIEDETQQLGLEIAEGGIDATILLDAIEKITKVGMEGGVRVIRRQIEKQITDGLIDAKADGAKKVRLEADGDRVRVIPVFDEPVQEAGAAEATAPPATATR
ncbi:MAG: AAA family ATPase, partial [Xanthobacteraceae bacterium]